jgi:ketosteroid isomerase-like protein
VRAPQWLVGSLALALVLGCQPKAEPPEQALARIESESAAARTMVDSLTREFMSHFNQGHGDLVAAFYSEQAHLMPPNQPAAVGREAIKAAFAPFFAMKADLKLTLAALVASGALAVERGTYSITYTPPGATAPVTDTGKYLVHWERIDGKWMLVDDIFNSDLPPLPMTGPAIP